MPAPVRIIGGGPAGAAAALAALTEGGSVTLFEQSAFPRHKVCGEFLSPEVEEVLRPLGAWNAFEEAGPARIRRVCLHVGAAEKRWTLAQPGFGLSRYALDALLLAFASERGATILREKAQPDPPPWVIAHGRKASAVRGRRLFGFKAHFSGPVDDAVELFFFERCYVGVSAVERESTNICGLAPEPILRECNFEIDELLGRNRPLAARMHPLTRQIPWLLSGPLIFSSALPGAPDHYFAGDALGFVDPFTGSGMLSALETGRLAGLAAVHNTAPAEHLALCRRRLLPQYRAAQVMRHVLETGLAAPLLRLVPGSMLFAWTRPRMKVP